MRDTPGEAKTRPYVTFPDEPLHIDVQVLVIQQKLT